MNKKDRIQIPLFSMRLVTVLGLFLFIQGCSFFGGDEEEAFDQPAELVDFTPMLDVCLLYTSPSPRDRQKSRMPSSA